MKLSVVVTVFNEEGSIVSLLESLSSQSVRPYEVVIVDGGSSDKTVILLKKYAASHPRLRLQVFTKKGNRSIGRNFGVKKSTGDIILFTDAGCILDKNWVSEISRPFSDKKIDVVAGYYKAKTENEFQKALVPFVLTMPDKLNPKVFLPATRSMAIRKSIFESLGGFDQRYSHNEDYVLARKIKDSGLKIKFARKALAIWMPRTSLRSTFRMFYRFALGDMEAGIVRGKVLLLFARYLLAGYVLVLAYLYKNPLIFSFVIASVGYYLYWALAKHRKYHRSPNARVFSGIIQIVSDISVMSGSIMGGARYFSHQALRFVKNHKLVSIIILAYSYLVLSVIDWGLPSISHPFVYHMDEWHFLNAIRSVASIGDPNIEGSAHTAMFYPFSSGIFLLPFILLKIINPFAVQSSFSDFEMQKRIFEVLRLHTFLSGVGVLVVTALISKYFIKIPSWILPLLVCFSPVFLSLSTFYKYDITLLFLSMLGCFFMFLYSSTKNSRDFFIASVVMGLTFATKFTALPLFVLIIGGYLLFTDKENFRWKDLLLGLTAFFTTFVLFGIPNLIFGKGSLGEYFYSNLVSAPGETSNIIFPNSFWGYMVFRQAPILLGVGLSVLLVSSGTYYLLIGIKGLISRDLRKHSREYFSLLTFLIFIASLAPLKVAAGGNRSLVLMSGSLLVIGYFLKYLLSSRLRDIVFVFLPFLLVVQILQGYSWIDARYTLDPRQSSSRWINAYIAPNTDIGIENIPIYQYIPDIALREFYLKEEKKNTKYDFIVVDAKTDKLPSLVIVSREDIASSIKRSPKNDLLDRLNKEGYQQVVEFEPKLPMFTNDFDFYISNIGPVFPVSQLAIFKKD